jgi:hypothetical protein
VHSKPPGYDGDDQMIADDARRRQCASARRKLVSWREQVQGETTAVPNKRVAIDDETWHALTLLARDRMMTFQEVADEAFAEILKKYNRPVTLKAALRRSAELSAEVVPFRPKGSRAGKTRKRPARD